MTVDGFLSQYTPATRINYEQVLYEAQYRIRKPIEKAGHADIVRYQRSIVHQAPATVARKLAVLQTLYRYLNAVKYRNDDPMAGIRRPRVDRYRSVQWLTDDEVSALLSTASTDQRSLSLCWLALHGLRVGEIAGLNVEQYQDGILWNVAGKGGKTRNIPLAADAVAALTAYIGQRRSGALFLGAQGRLRHRRIQALVYTLTETIGHRVSIHALRHTYGTKAVRRGVQTLLLSKLMGHESPITTGKYVHLNTDDVRPVNDLVYPKQGLKVIDGQKEAI